MLQPNFALLPQAEIQVDTHSRQGPFEGWRHSMGHGAINNTPLPDRVIQGIKNLKPRLIRVFLQEYFNIYPDHGIFNWSLLDPYMEALAKTGAKVLATVNLKPPPLFPKIDHAIWQPNNVAEWQNVIYQLVKRYSVEKPFVTHWEHANEPDIGEPGACPYWITTAEENHAFYQMLVKPILDACPTAKVGGPAMADIHSPILKGFIDLCRENNTQLDFVSWHRYTHNLEEFPSGVEKIKAYLSGFPEKRPEMMWDEWNYGFDFSDLGHSTYQVVSVEDMAMSARRAAFTAANILSLMDTDLDWSHYFLIWDNCCYPDQFRSFYSEASLRQVMYKHWNEQPARFGLFSEGQEVRPPYFVFQMISRMGDEVLASSSSREDIRVKAASRPGQISLLIVNFDSQKSQDVIAQIHFTNLQPGTKKLTAYRIDDQRRWSPEDLELIPVERRTVATLPDFHYQFYSPADSVLLATLEDVT